MVMYMREVLNIDGVGFVIRSPSGILLAVDGVRTFNKIVPIVEWCAT